MYFLLLYDDSSFCGNLYIRYVHIYIHIHIYEYEENIHFFLLIWLDFRCHSIRRDADVSAALPLEVFNLLETVFCLFHGVVIVLLLARFPGIRTTFQRLVEHAFTQIDQAQIGVQDAFLSRIVNIFGEL